MNAITVPSAMRLHLSQEGACTLETLLYRLSQFSWSETRNSISEGTRHEIGRHVLSLRKTLR